MKKALFTRLAVISAVGAGATGSAMAAIPENVTTALSALSTDALQVAGRGLIEKSETRIPRNLS